MNANDQVKTSHKEILKSTGIIGVEQVIVVLASVFRTKAVALLLGPMGVGIAGLYQSAIDLIRYATGFGLGFSAVRDVAEAAGTGDQKQVSRIIRILRRWVWFTGILGMIVVLVLSRKLSEYSFGNASHAWEFSILSVTILLTAVSSGQLAVLQGLRKIAFLAKSNVAAVLIGLIVALPLYWYFGNEGIVFSMLAIAVVTLGSSWYYARRIPVPPVRLSAKEAFGAGLGMAKLGFFVAVTSLMSTGTMYAVRLLILRKMDLDAVGQFQAAWTISSVYLATVLNAMGADYFPRLSAATADHQVMNRLVNEQTETALLIAGPLIVFMLSFCHLFVRVLYSAKFGIAENILHWQILGTFVKLVAWPVGFVFLAKRKAGTFTLLEAIWNLSYFFIVLFGRKIFGIEVTGISFLVAYLLGSALNFLLARRISGFAWSARSLWLMLLYGVIIILAFFQSGMLPGAGSYAAGTLLTFVSISVSIHYLRGIVDFRAIIATFFGAFAKKSQA